MFDRHREHEGSATTVLSDFAGGIGIALHEGDKAGRCEGRVLDGSAFGPDM